MAEVLVPLELVLVVMTWQGVCTSMIWLPFQGHCKVSFVTRSCCSGSKCQQLHWLSMKMQAVTLNGQQQWQWQLLHHVTTTLSPAAIDVDWGTTMTTPTSSGSQHFTLPSLHKLITIGGRGLSQSVTSLTVSTVVIGASWPRRVLTCALRTRTYSLLYVLFIYSYPVVIVRSSFIEVPLNRSTSNVVPSPTAGSLANMCYVTERPSWHTKPPVVYKRFSNEFKTKGDWNTAKCFQPAMTRRKS